ncbi:MAG: hypothetical protein Kow00121_64620 [Elainellaceae cyanobacterium]
MFQLTISGTFVSIVVPNPAAALKLQLWAEENFYMRGATVAIFVNEPGFPYEFWIKMLLR